MSNIVAIVGRPNVGKSTLFNRLTESRNAIVKEVSGVTRDRIYGKGEWSGFHFSVIDTGGYAKTREDIFEGEIRKQVEIAIEEATVILFMVDVTTGIVEMDNHVAQILRRTKKPILVVANKVDNTERVGLSSEFYAFGFDQVFDLSATNGSGTGEILDEVVKYFRIEDLTVNEENTLPRIAIVGKPNVGKSSLLNAMVGGERNIVTDISGTTRDSVHTRFKSFGFDFLLIDTAGIRKRAKVQEDIEYYSVLRSVRTIENADVCLFMIDAKEGIQKQDLHIYYIIEKNAKGVVVLVNKWDLIEKDQSTMLRFEEQIKEALAPFNDVPIIFTSTISKQRVHKAIEASMEVFKNRTQKIPTRELNDAMLEVININPPPAVKGKYIRIKFVQQLPTHAPTFAFYCNLPQYIGDSYKRFLENKLRTLYNFKGVPIKIFFRKK